MKNSLRMKKGLRLLSLDGGGIRGLSELIIIQTLMEQLRERLSLPRTPKPAEYFDLIGGTSTGGLIAILLGRLRLSAADAIQAYEELAEKIFSEKHFGPREGKFKASTLEQTIKELVESSLGRSGAKMYDPDDNTDCKAFVCAVSALSVTETTGPNCFRTYDVLENSHNCEIWEAARATSAAPTYFSSIEIGPPASKTRYMDAGLGYNNPVKQVTAEAVTLFGSEAPVTCIVSIGTGLKKKTSYDKPGVVQKIAPTKLAEVLQRIATNSEIIAEEMKRRCRNIPGIYYRLNVDHGLDSVELDEWKRMREVTEHTKSYLKLEDVKQQVKNIVEALCGESHFQSCSAALLDGVISSPISDIGQLNVPSIDLPHFVDRSNLFTAIETQLLDAMSSKTVVLIGMGGSGKTQLALQFCRRAEFMAVAWIDASSPASVLQSYRAIAKQIPNPPEPDTDEDAVMSLVKGAFHKFQRSWLVVLDNYDNPKAFSARSIKEYIPLTGKNGHVLITSRHRDSARLGQEIVVSSMTEDESVNLLLRREAQGDEASESAVIASTLGYLPLALDQAGSYIRARDLQLKDFISRYEECKKSILSETPEQWDYRRSINERSGEYLSVFTTWELSFEQLSGDEHEKGYKERFLTLAAFFDNKKIAERYFKALYDAEKPAWMTIFGTDEKWDTFKFEKLLTEFRKLLLVQTLTRRNDQSYFSFHPVVRDWIQLRVNLEKQQQALVELIAALEYSIKDTEVRVVGKNSKFLSQANGSDPHDRAVGNLTEGRTYSIRRSVLDFDAYFHIVACALTQSGPGALGHKILTGESKASLDRHPGSAFYFAKLCERALAPDAAEELYEIAQKGQKKLNSQYPSADKIEQAKNSNARRLKTFRHSSDAKLDEFRGILYDGVISTQMTMIRDDGTEEDWGNLMMHESETFTLGLFKARNNIQYLHMERGTTKLSKEIPKDVMDFVLCLREAISILSTEGREEDVELCKPSLEFLEREGARFVESRPGEFD